MMLLLPKRRTGATEELNLINGVIKKSMLVPIQRPLMIKVCTKAQPRPPGRLLDPVSLLQSLTTEPITLITQYLR